MINKAGCLAAKLDCLLCVLLQSIRRMIDKKTIDVYAMFNDELNSIKKELTQKLVALPASHPKYAGQAHWARMLKRGIERSMTVSVSSLFLCHSVALQIRGLIF